MAFIFETKLSDSPFVEAIYTTQSTDSGSFMSSAESRWEMVITKQRSDITVMVRGPETKASPAPIPENAEFMGIIFRLGTFMPHLPIRNFVNDATILPQANTNTFWFNGASWQLPDFENVDTFISRLMRNDLIVRDPVVDAVLQGHHKEISLRSVQRRFVHATGLTHIAIRQIDRAKQAMTMLQQGHSILDTVFDLGYTDQPHMTKSLKHFLGRTPSQILNDAP